MKMCTMWMFSSILVIVDLCYIYFKSITYHLSVDFKTTLYELCPEIDCLSLFSIKGLESDPHRHK